MGIVVMMRRKMGVDWIRRTKSNGVIWGLSCSKTNATLRLNYVVWVQVSYAVLDLFVIKISCRTGTRRRLYGGDPTCRSYVFLFSLDRWCKFIQGLMVLCFTQ